MKKFQELKKVVYFLSAQIGIHGLLVQEVLGPSNNTVHSNVLSQQEDPNCIVTGYLCLFLHINTIIHRSSLPALPTYDSLSSLSHSFPKFF